MHYAVAMRYLSKPEIARLLKVAYAENRTHHLAMLTCFWTGARVSQTLALRGVDVFESAGVVKIKVYRAKRGKDVFPQLHVDESPEFDMSPLVELAKTRGTGKLFGSLSRQYFDVVLKRYGRLAGLHKDFCHSHVFRHSIAMEIWDATHRLGAITTFLAHKSPNSALQYLSENDGMLAQAAVNAIRL
jgi:integrase